MKMTGQEESTFLVFIRSSFSKSVVVHWHRIIFSRYICVWHVDYNLTYSSIGKDPFCPTCLGMLLDLSDHLSHSD
ncbi:hypothetical protein ZIOFF_017732 [Zingiber officinale]|uniref:Uncharacterized protein n=1 Tax=Zingiber officinale TaxID=94328 RepID=A0A8J5H5G6_ZINOF|nr:hypothetical protein ZIOFF_017732 [Zingiber officinale]